MSNQKVTQLAENTGVAYSDIAYIVDDPGGSPASEKCTAQNFVKGGASEGAVSELIDSNLTGSKSLVSDASGKITTTNAEFVDKSGDTLTGSLKINNAADADSDADDVLNTEIDASHGVLIVGVTSDDKTAIYRTEGQTLTAISANSDFSVTKDTASKYNVYYETDQFKVQNKVGDNKIIKIGFIGV